MRIVINRAARDLHFSFSFENRKAIRTVSVVLSALAVAACALGSRVADLTPDTSDRSAINFDGERAYQHVVSQVEFGPRVPGSEAHERTRTWIAENMDEAGWEIEFQEFSYGGYELSNIIARREPSLQAEAPLILGAHYDSRLFADRDLKDPEKPVPGANDGASGVAVLLELARVLDTGSLQQPVWIVFFDAEDNGRIQGWDWILGSRFFVDQLQIAPSAAVIVDMVGDADLQLYLERNSDERLREMIWQVAGDLGYEQFIPAEKYSILDDHTPFIQAGVPAVDIIDFDYDYFHTTGDTPDKVSAQSLESVGRTLEVWLESGG